MAGNAPKLNAISHILVVDDEAEMRDSISEYLGMRDFAVSEAANGKEMWNVLEKTEIDLILLDLGLPGEDGIVLARELRATSSSAIIIVTAFGETEDRVLGLESGADDYVVKPFSLRELVARVRSVLRRQQTAAGQQPPNNSARLLQLGNNTYNTVTRELSRPDGSAIELTSGECDLLGFFVDNPDRPLSRDELLKQTAHRDWEFYDRSIDVRINRLRRKIEIDASNPQVVRTVRGVGYLFKTQNS
jgi:two-component system OmpR family response regulator